MAQRLTALAVLAEDLGSVPLPTHHNHQSSCALFRPPPAPGTHMMHVHASRQNTGINKLFFNLKKVRTIN